MALLLERHEVDGLLDLKTAIEVTRSAFVEQGKGQVLSQAPTMLHVVNGALRIVQGALLESNVMGARLTKAAGFKSGGSLAVIYDADTGELLAVMSFPLGVLRTGAVVGLATEMLSRQNAEVVGLIGTGQNAIGLLQGVTCVRPVRKIIKVYSRDPGHRNRFAEQVPMQRRLFEGAIFCSSPLIPKSQCLILAPWRRGCT